MAAVIYSLIFINDNPIIAGPGTIAGGQLPPGSTLLVVTQMSPIWRGRDPGTFKTLFTIQYWIMPR